MIFEQYGRILLEFILGGRHMPIKTKENIAAIVPRHENGYLQRRNTFVRDAIGRQ